MSLKWLLLGALWILCCEAGSWLSTEINCCKTTDQQHMMAALQLASRALGKTRPNPCVGCVITDINGDLVGQGWHAKAGLAHAEVVALSEAGERAVNGTAYVSLEPCNHYGRTPPCTQALIRSGIKRVVVGLVDPDLRVSGQGIQVLRDHGIDVFVMNGSVNRLSEQLNAHFLYRVRHGRPHLTAWYGCKNFIQCMSQPNDSCKDTMQCVRGNITSALMGVDTLMLSTEQVHNMTVAETRALLEMLPTHVSVLVTHNNYADTSPSVITKSLVDKIQLLQEADSALSPVVQRKWYLFPFYNRSSDTSCNTALNSANVTVLPSLFDNTSENHHSACEIYTFNTMLSHIGTCTGCNGALMVCDTEARMKSVVDDVRRSGAGVGSSSRQLDDVMIMRVLLTRCTSNVDTAVVDSDSCMTQSNGTAEAPAMAFVDWCDWLPQNAKCDALPPCRLSIVRRKISRGLQRALNLPRWLASSIHRAKSVEVYSRVEDQDGGIEKRWRLTALCACSIYRIGC